MSIQEPFTAELSPLERLALLRQQKADKQSVFEKSPEAVEAASVERAEDTFVEHDSADDDRPEPGLEIDVESVVDELQEIESCDRGEASAEPRSVGVDVDVADEFPNVSFAADTDTDTAIDEDAEDWLDFDDHVADDHGEEHRVDVDSTVLDSCVVGVGVVGVGDDEEGGEGVESPVVESAEIAELAVKEVDVPETAADVEAESSPDCGSVLADLLDTPVEELSFDFSDIGVAVIDEPAADASTVDQPYEKGAVDATPLSADDHVARADLEQNGRGGSGHDNGADGFNVSEPNETAVSDCAIESPVGSDSPATKSAGDQPQYIKTGRGGVKKVGGSSHLNDLFERVNDLLGDTQPTNKAWKPPAPVELRDTGLSSEDVERITLKFLSSKGSASGRAIAHQLRLPFNIVEPLLKEWKQSQLIGFKNAAEMGDYVYVITDFGRDKARTYMVDSTYFGAAPVQLTDYLKAMEQQSIAKQHATEADLKRAFSDLLISEAMFDRLGPAINSGRGMFLFGEPGNGKTSIAERITACFGSSIWIPRALGIDGDIIRLFDPGVHEAVDWDDTVSSATGGLFNVSGVDPRWIQIKRPTVVAGGELTMDELEVTQNPQTRVCEAPLQLKSNCGTLVIDDFGRQTMPVDQLLNRWIVPLEKRYDFLNLPSGKKIQVPFDQLIVFSTNLEPKDLVDGAFLRRIPYKIEVPDPIEEHFRKLFHIMAPSMGLRVDDESIDYLVSEHFHKADRPFRACLPRDLLLQVRNYCLYKSLPKVMTPEAFDFAVANYFSVM